ncbi:MAG: siderophore biosynthesis protein [Pseudarthrobacter sp.]|nr:siderophore biosynthesis protein [Pseudarthrobacter sp.]
MTNYDLIEAPGLRPAVYEEELPAWGHLRLVAVAPADDVDVIHAWVTAERARFWGMTSYSRSDVLEVYTFLDSLDTHHAYLIELAGEPLGIFQTYQPLHDPVGEAYPAQPGDAGLHLLLGPAARPIPHFTPVLAAALTRFMFSDPATDRIIVEPDARNTMAIKRLLATSFELGPIIQLPDKEAQLAFLTRARFEEGNPPHAMA